MGAVYSGSIEVSRQDDLDYLLMCEKYKDYIETHKANVLRSYEELLNGKDYSTVLPNGISVEEWNDTIDELREEIIHHDDSKYSDEEFEPYRRRFNKTKMEELADKENPEQAELVKAEFEKAWIHHYLINPHHPEFWNHTDMINGQLIPSLEPRKDGPRDMDLLNILHMICDWAAMSLKFRGKLSPISWYNTQANDERKAMSENTKDRLKEILMMLFPGEEVL